MSLTAILTTTLILFSVIDIIGSLPVILDLKQRGVRIHSATSTLAAGVLMTAFLFFGTALLGLFGIEVSSFAIAGALIILFIALEMVLGVRIFRDFESQVSSGSIVPIAFPLLTGAGTLTTVISLRADYAITEIMISIAINVILIYVVLRSSSWLERKMSDQLKSTLRKVFGILLIAMAVQMLRTHLGMV
jgi:multiple antibiotic resistance protein